MAELDLEEYFEKDDKKYYDASYLITILEDVLGGDLDRIKAFVADESVVVTEDRIKQYLDAKFEEENYRLKKKIENRQDVENTYDCKWTKAEINEKAQRFIDDMEAEKYQFEPYTLEYFKTYTNILKQKIFSLLDLIEKIGREDTTSIKDTMNSLDIQLSSEGNISKEDIVRLIMPTIYNINKLSDMIDKANNLPTYLDFKLTKYAQEMPSEGSIYPTKDLQVKDLDYGFEEGNIPLSSGQVRTLEKEQKKQRKKHIKKIGL